MFKKKLRILPIFICLSVLMLSIKISYVVNTINNSSQHSIRLETQAAFAEEDSATTQALSTALKQGSQEDISSGKAPGPTFTESEVAILQDLAQRREALDMREKEIDKKALQLHITEEEINKKLEQLQAYESKLRDLIQDYKEKEQGKLAALVKLYTSMKPQDAARIINTLDIELATALLRGMKPTTSSAILSKMDAAKAKAVTNHLIGNSLTNIEK